MARHSSSSSPSSSSISSSYSSSTSNYTSSSTSSSSTSSSTSSSSTSSSSSSSSTSSKSVSNYEKGIPVGKPLKGGNSAISVISAAPPTSEFSTRGAGGLVESGGAGGSPDAWVTVPVPDAKSGVVFRPRGFSVTTDSLSTVGTSTAWDVKSKYLVAVRSGPTECPDHVLARHSNFQNPSFGKNGSAAKSFTSPYTIFYFDETAPNEVLLKNDTKKKSNKPKSLKKKITPKEKAELSTDDSTCGSSSSYYSSSVSSTADEAVLPTSAFQTDDESFTIDNTSASNLNPTRSSYTGGVRGEQRSYSSRIPLATGSVGTSIGMDNEGASTYGSTSSSYVTLDKPQGCCGRPSRRNTIEGSSSSMVTGSMSNNGSISSSASSIMYDQEVIDDYVQITKAPFQAHGKTSRVPPSYPLSYKSAAASSVYSSKTSSSKSLGSRRHHHSKGCCMTKRGKANHKSSSRKSSIERRTTLSSTSMAKGTIQEKDLSTEDEDEDEIPAFEVSRKKESSKNLNYTIRKMFFDASDLRVPKHGTGLKLLPQYSVSYKNFPIVCYDVIAPEEYTDFFRARKVPGMYK